MLIRILHQANDAVGIGLAENILAVGFYRSLTDEQGFGYLFVVVFFLYQADDLCLPGGKMGRFIFFFALAGALQFTNHFIAEINTAGGYLLPYHPVRSWKEPGFLQQDIFLLPAGLIHYRPIPASLHR